MIWSDLEGCLGSTTTTVKVFREIISIFLLILHYLRFKTGIWRKKLLILGFFSGASGHVFRGDVRQAEQSQRGVGVFRGPASSEGAPIAVWACDWRGREWQTQNRARRFSSFRLWRQRCAGRLEWRSSSSKRSPDSCPSKCRRPVRRHTRTWCGVMIERRPKSQRTFLYEFVRFSVHSW